MGLIFSFSLPILAAWQGSENAINYSDYIISFLMLLFIITETIADQQQYNFQSEKYRRLRNGENLEGMYKDGFISNGLWAYSRAPKFCQ